MSRISSSFTAVGLGGKIAISKGDSLEYKVTGFGTATIQLWRVDINGNRIEQNTEFGSKTAVAAGILSNLKEGLYALYCSAYTSGTIVGVLSDAVSNAERAAAADEQERTADLVGAVSTVAGVDCAITQLGPRLYALDFTLTSVAVAITDAGASGAGGGVKLFDLVAGMWQCLGSRQDLTLASDTTLDVAGDLALVHGLGSAAANAGDGALTGTEVDWAAISGTVTLSANAGTSPSVGKGAGTPVDGTSTASDIYLNFSATAATADATGVLTVSGTVTMLMAYLGDD